MALITSRCGPFRPTAGSWRTLSCVCFEPGRCPLPSASAVWLVYHGGAARQHGYCTVVAALSWDLDPSRPFRHNRSRLSPRNLCGISRKLSHHLRALQVDGSVEESMVDESVSRMYTLMHRLGIFDAKPAYGGIGSWPREQSRKRMYSSDHVVQSRPKNGPIGWALRH